MYGSNASPFGQRGSGASLYSRVGVETDVGSASPHRLVALLFEGVFTAMNQARAAIQAGDLSLKARALSRAVRILDEGLKAALNLESGQLANDLRDLYSWLCMRLTQANLHSDIKAIDECQRVLAPVRDAWIAIGEHQPQLDAA
ncbi:MAG: flagellar export chaperone FliS [Paucibacter sp.]|nr:flagellar export chaperone FliS [Roseateles sp.]